MNEPDEVHAVKRFNLYVVSCTGCRGAGETAEDPTQERQIFAVLCDLGLHLRSCGMCKIIPTEMRSGVSTTLADFGD